MKKDKNQSYERTVGGSNEGLNQEPEWARLQLSLRAMVADESEHVRSKFLTDNILRAVRSSSANRNWLDELWPGLMRSWLRLVVVAGILLVVLLAAYNARPVSSDLVDRSATERVFGLYTITVASAYDIDLESISR